MNVSVRRPAMTREAFLDWLGTEDGRWEFDGFRPVAMTGGTNSHGRISGNIYFGLRRRLGSGPCEALTAESGGIATPGNKVCYPDITVTCSHAPGTERLIPSPVVVFEVVSPSSKRDDHHEKPAEYGAVPSIACYAIVEQDRKAVRVFRRGADGTWREDRPPGDTLDLPEVGVSLPLDEIYEGVLPAG